MATCDDRMKVCVVWWLWLTKLDDCFSRCIGFHYHAGNLGSGMCLSQCNENGCRKHRMSVGFIWQAWRICLRWYMDLWLEQGRQNLTGLSPSTHGTKPMFGRDADYMKGEQETKVKEGRSKEFRTKEGGSTSLLLTIMSGCAWR